MELLGTSKNSTKNKITIIKEVADMLKIKHGDLVAFYGDGNGNVIIKKAVITPG